MIYRDIFNEVHIAVPNAVRFEEALLFFLEAHAISNCPSTVIARMPPSKTHVTSSTENLPEGGFQESQLPFSSHWPVDCRQRSEHCVCVRHTRTITQQNKHCNPQFKSSTVGSKATRCQPQHHWTNGPLQIPSITLDGTWTEKEPPLFKSPFLVKLLWKSVDSVDTAFRYSHSQQTCHHACLSRPASFQLRSALLPLRVLES